VAVEIAVVVGFFALLVIPLLFGMDSRDGRDSQPRCHR
jgi:hypothetical protein